MKQEDRQRAIEQALVIKEKVKDDLLSRRNVVGLGIGLKTVAGQKTGEIALVVLVSRKEPMASLAVQDCIPTEIEGVLIDVQEVGEIQPHT
jgi:hypothetical protein